MRVIEQTIYTLNELSDSAKERAYINWCNHFDYGWDSENRDSWSAFESRTQLGQWHDGNILELSGIRAATWIHNNWTWLWNGKYYCRKYPKVRYSQIILERSCITGYHMDCDCTDPIFEFLARPNSNTIQDILNECRESYERAYQNDYEFLQSYECFEESCEANDYEFDVRGEMQ